MATREHILAIRVAILDQLINDEHRIEKAFCLFCDKYKCCSDELKIFEDAAASVLKNQADSKQVYTDILTYLKTKYNYMAGIINVYYGKTYSEIHEALKIIIPSIVAYEEKKLPPSDKQVFTDIFEHLKSTYKENIATIAEYETKITGKTNDEKCTDLLELIQRINPNLSGSPAASAAAGGAVASGAAAAGNFVHPDEERYRRWLQSAPQEKSECRQVFSDGALLNPGLTHLYEQLDPYGDFIDNHEVGQCPENYKHIDVIVKENIRGLCRWCDRYRCCIEELKLFEKRQSAAPGAAAAGKAKYLKYKQKYLQLKKLLGK